jgi:AICAR transformylase/IMP cyclohydrolase PurH
MKDDTKTSTVVLLASDGAFDPLEDGVRQRVRSFIEAILQGRGR